MRQLLIAIFCLSSLSSFSQAVEADQYAAITSFVKSEVEWLYFDDRTGERELVILNEARMTVEEREGLYFVSAEVIEVDEELGNRTGEVRCEISLTVGAYGLRADRTKSTCECFAKFQCGEREGNLFEE